jgi:hypothetical protein
LAGALGGPFEYVAISLLASVFHFDSTKIADIANAITNDPNAESKLKSLELQHIETLN